MARTSSSSSGSSARFALISFTDFKDVSLRLSDANFFQWRPGTRKRAGPILLQASVNRQAQVLGGGNDSRERFHLLVEIFVIERLEYPLPHEPVERRRVHHAARAGIEGAAH